MLTNNSNWYAMQKYNFLLVTKKIWKMPAPHPLSWQELTYPRSFLMHLILQIDFHHKTIISWLTIYICLHEATSNVNIKLMLTKYKVLWWPKGLQIQQFSPPQKLPFSCQVQEMYAWQISHNFKSHINNVSKKLSKSTAMLYRLRDFMPY